MLVQRTLCFKTKKYLYRVKGALVKHNRIDDGNSTLSSLIILPKLFGFFFFLFLALIKSSYSRC